GYQLLKRFGQRLGPFWHPNIGQVYQLLHDLERRRLIARRDERHGTRSRRRFRLTDRGERALRPWRARPPRWPPPLPPQRFAPFLAGERHGPDAVRSQLDRQEAEYRRYLALIHEEDGHAGSSVTRRMAHEAALGHAEAHLRWLARCRELLASSRDSVSAREQLRA